MRAIDAVTDQSIYALLIAQHDAAVDDLIRATVLAGGDVRLRLSWSSVADELTRVAARGIVLLDCAGVDEAHLASLLPTIDAFATERSMSVVARIAPSQIDVASSALVASQAQLLCEESALDLQAALATAVVAQRHDVGAERLSEGEAARLARLNEEVARIADVLARLGRRGDDNERARENRPSFEAAPANAPTVASSEIRQLLRTRRLRDRIFANGLFGDPAWDMILDLFAAHLERAHVSVSSLCIASNVPPTTALRWIAKLTEAGLFDREADPFDKRRAFITLSKSGVEAMYRYIAATRDQDLPIA